MKEKGTHPNSFYEATIILTSKPDTDTKENYRSISFMNVDVKKFNKIASSLMWHIKRIIHHDQVWLSQEYKTDLVSKNQMEHTTSIKKKPTKQKSSFQQRNSIW